MPTPESSRRHFLKLSGMSLAAVPLVGLTPFPLDSQAMTIQEVIDKIISQIPGGKQAGTVDTVKSGDPSQAVRGIVTTFLATVDVIRAAIEQDANLIITHEPTYYEHTDGTEWLKDDPVYTYKRDLLEKHNIVVWRYHDYWHTYRPDGILHGLLDRLDWHPYLDENRENTAVIPTISLKKLARFFKKRLDLDRTFIVGDPDLSCHQIGLLPGAWGRGKQIKMLRTDIEVLVVGEVSEWETAEYVRDAAAAGMKKGLIVLGHAQSEEPGMAYAQKWLTKLIPGVPVYHVAAHDPFQPV